MSFFYDFLFSSTVISNIYILLLLLYYFITGQCALYFLLGKIHFAWSCLSSTPDYSKIKHIKTAMKIFDLLLHNKNSKSRISDLPQDNGGLGGAFTVLSRSFGLTNEKEDIIPEQKNVDNLWSKEISLRFAVCIAELGDIPAATKYAKDILQTTDLQNNSQMLHLLSLLTSSTGDCEKVRQTDRQINNVFV
jgi:hypothetical protein